MSNVILYSGVNIPPEDKNYMERPKIDSLLRRSSCKPLVAVVACAGFGKTQAVANFLKNYDGLMRANWFLLNELDNKVSRYSERFIYTSSVNTTTLADKLLTLELPFTKDTYERYHQIMLASSSDRKIILVLDDYNYIDNPVILEFMENHVMLNISNFVVILITRKKPAFNLDGLTSTGLAKLITEDDLKFTKEEISQYFEGVGISLMPETIIYIYEYTNGWPFAINCLAQILQSSYLNNYHYVKNEELITALKIKSYDYIKTEIFYSVPKSTQDFLVKLSFLDKLPCSLLEKLDASFSQEMFRDICFFIGYNKASSLFEFNGLFKDFLQEMQMDFSHKQINDIYTLSADWYNNNDYKIEAIKCYEKCGNHSKLFEIIFNFKEFCTFEIANYFISLIENAPPEFTCANPIINVVHARYLMNTLDYAKSYDILTTMLDQFNSAPDSEEKKYILGETYIMLAWVSMLTRTYDFITLFKRASDYLPSGSRLINNEIQLIPGNNTRVKSIYKVNHIETYEQAYFEAMPYAVKVMNGCGNGLDYFVSADAAYSLKDYKKAKKTATEAVKRAAEQNQIGIKNYANFILLKVSLANGDCARCFEILDEIKSQKLHYPTNNLSEINLIQYQIIEGWFYNSIGETSKVPSWIISQDKPNKQSLPVLVNEKNILRARCLLTDGKHFELLAFLEQLLLSYVDKELLIINIHLPIIKAISLYYIGEKEESFVLIEEAYSLSKQSGIIMPFIEYGTKMRTIIYALRRSENCTIPKPWLDNVYSKSSTYAKQIAKAVDYYKKDNSIASEKTTLLGKREREIVFHLCHGLTREQIATACNLSINTVKSSLQNIYSKLGASDKQDAIRIAIELKLNK